MGFADGFNKWLAAKGKEPCDPELSGLLDESFAETKAAMMDPNGAFQRGARELVEALLEAQNGKPEKWRTMVKEALELKAKKDGKR